MGFRKVVVKKSAAENIASIAWYIESKGMMNTAEKFADSIHDYFFKLADITRSYSICKEPTRAIFGYKCV